MSLRQDASCDESDSGAFIFRDIEYRGNFAFVVGRVLLVVPPQPSESSFSNPMERPMGVAVNLSVIIHSISDPDYINSEFTVDCSLLLVWEAGVL